MDRLWLLKGRHNVPGWKGLQADSKAETLDVVLFDRDKWALIMAEEPPTGYEGFEVSGPPDGLYVDHNGNSVCILAGAMVPQPEQVIEALGDEATSLLEKLGDPILVLERLGRAY